MPVSALPLAALRALLFRRASPVDLTMGAASMAGAVAPGSAAVSGGPVPAVLLAVLLAMVLQGFEGLLLNGLPGHVEWSTLPDLLFPVAILWLSCWAAGVLLDQPGQTMTVFTDLLGVRVLLLALALLVQWPLARWPDRVWLEQPTDHLLNLLQLWWLLAGLVRLGRVGAVSRLRRLLAWSAFAGPALVLLVLFPVTDLWQGDNAAPEEGPSVQAMREDVFYEQPGLLDDALQSLQPERSGVDDLYFVGFAGDAGTPAIRNEVELAHDLLAQRFDTAGRSVVLANDLNPSPVHPFATRSALAATFARLAEVMDVEDDILLLFLSSHGTRAGTLALAQPALALGDIDPPGLRKALDQSGIRWRIVIVSACYSGAFVDALRDERTLVITASDATHPSFGCGTADRYTWFGQAYFDQALRRSLSFTDAFNQAARTIRAREKAMGEVPSNPQMALGRAMVAKLAALQTRLGQPGGPSGSVQAGATGSAGARAVLLWQRQYRRPQVAPTPGGRRFQARISGVNEHSSVKISSFNRSLRFFSRRNASSSTVPPSP